MTETQIDALKAFLDNSGTLANKLDWRQRVLTALVCAEANRSQQAKEARERNDGAAEHEHTVHVATLKGFRDIARMGGNWKRWLYLVEPSADEAAWLAYVAACEAENLNAHDPHMWKIHGCPSGPIGGN